ncbi:hypothetical protein DFR58_10383 [Anaerobacterium chartisolvens]|uniref:DUF3221 domain-containing protein n=1 Tax=Anaerobacterium chartisolvens TaxID=1297424 RepID=A0A369BFF0_9FIRM|nr:hypothetical protein [Anaerobacterium chartisolvens]RCX19338.1 hypothetical protein DFR58_10383 [Anaerobacterium chartisolvens]
MNRYIALSLLLVCIFVLTGCENKGEKTNEVTATKTYFEATVLEVSDTYLLVEPLEGTLERKSADRIKVSTGDIGEEKSLNYLSEAQAGDTVEIGYHGGIAESYPAQINSAYEIKLVAREEAAYDKIPMVMAGGQLYCDTGKESTITARCGVMDGEITSTVEGTQIPTKNDQSNFGTGYGYQFVTDGQIEVYINNKWFIFEKRSEDG